MSVVGIPVGFWNPPVVLATADEVAALLAAIPTAAEIAAAFRGRVTVNSAVTTGLDLEIIAGDDYTTANGRALSWSNTSGTWCNENLTNATIELVVVELDNSPFMTLSGSVVSATGIQIVTVDLSASNSVLFTRSGSKYKYQLKATKSAKVETLVYGDVSTILAYSES